MAEWTADGAVSAHTLPLVAEHRIVAEVNGQPCWSVMCTPGEDEELVIGRLFTEGYIDEYRELLALDMESQEDGSVLARATLARREELADAPLADVPSVGAAGRVMRRFASRMAREEYLTVGEYRPWRLADVFALYAAFAPETPLHRLTGVTHSCALVQDGKIIHVAEDIGRHNTVDKAIGWAMRQGVELRNTMLFVSGRVPTDMMVKAVRAGFAAVVSRKLPTQEAVDMARKYRVTLVGKLRENSALVFSGLDPQ